VTLAGIKTEPLAIWDANDMHGLFWRHHPEASAWAIEHLGRDVANRTFRVGFHLVDAPFAVLQMCVRDENGRLLNDPATGDLAFAELVVQMLDELPPAHLLGR
jgi:hypothetical protein